MPDWNLIVGDCREVLRSLPAQSVHTCVTSPPYFGLRDYGNDGQIGLEPTPDEFVTALVAVFREVRRVLRDDGTVWLNLGDSYAVRAQAHTKDPAGFQGTASLAAYLKDIPDGCKPKDLIGIPWAVAQALRAPYYGGEIKAERDRVWLAATLDAEGCISGFTHERADGDGIRTGVHITITNTNERLLAEADRIWPASRVEHENHGEGHLGRRGSWRWLPHGAESKALLMRELYPYMIAKREQARLAYALFALSVDAKRLGHSPQRDAVREKRAWIVAALSRLNQGEGVDVPSWIGEPPTVEEPGWYLRSDIIWAKPNPMPESVTDRPTKSHEYLFLLSKAPRYFYDADAIREEVRSFDDPRGPDRMATGWDDLSRRGLTPEVGQTGHLGIPPNGRNKRSVWHVATQPYPGAHFATFPPKLIEPCILAGSPERACSVCGAPWVRVVEKGESDWRARKDAGAPMRAGDHNGGQSNPNPGWSGASLAKWKAEHPDRLVGFEPSCECGDDAGKRNGFLPASSVPGVVLDPFAGAGTTGVAALRHNRDFIGIELNAEYAELARPRLERYWRDEPRAVEARQAETLFDHPTSEGSST